MSGTVTAASGSAIAGAVVSVRSVESGTQTETRTDSGGRYSLGDLAAGDYAVSASAAGYDTTSLGVTLAAGETRTVDLRLAAALSLEDLGFSTAQTQGSTEEQARLNRRTHMLKVHQELGLVTAASFLATLVSSTSAGGRVSSSSSRDLHAGLGIVTTGLYFTTACYAIFAPKISGTRTRGPIRVHKALAWIHGTGMVLTPVLGGIAYGERSRGERVHGIASAHGAVAAVTAVTYGAAILSVSLKF